MPQTGHHHHKDHDHGDGHAHTAGAHAGHGHDLRHINRRRLGWAALLTGGFMVVEVGGGYLSGSLALLADAGHMFADFAALALAWFGARLSERPADWKRTYGFDRFSVLVAFVNGLSLFVIAGLILFEAVQRFGHPPVIAGPLMLTVAGVGLLVNVAAFFMLHGADRSNLNVRGAVVHVMGDLLGSVAAIVAAAIIIIAGWEIADPILSVLVAVLILRGGWSVVRDAGHILLEAAPAEMDSREIRSDLIANVAEVDDVHHVHIWSISEERSMMTLHAQICEDAVAENVTAAIKQRLARQFGMDHVTVEIERGECADTSVDTGT